MTLYGFGFQSAVPNSMADDFTVSDAGGWQIDEMVFFGYQTGSSTTSTFTEVYAQIYNGPPDAGGTVVWGDFTTNLLSSTAWTNTYRVLDTDLTASNRPVMSLVATIGTLLPQGSYWVEWAANGTGASGPWAPPISILGLTTTGNALQNTTSWGPALDGSFPQGMPFIVDGTVQGGGGGGGGGGGTGAAAEPVPTLSKTGAVVLILALIGISAVLIRRRM